MFDVELWAFLWAVFHGPQGLVSLGGLVEAAAHMAAEQSQQKLLSFRRFCRVCLWNHARGLPKIGVPFLGGPFKGILFYLGYTRLGGTPSQVYTGWHATSFVEVICQAGGTPKPYMKQGLYSCSW